MARGDGRVAVESNKPYRLWARTNRSTRYCARQTRTAPLLLAFLGLEQLLGFVEESQRGLRLGVDSRQIPAGFLGNQSVAQIGEGLNFQTNDAYTYPDAAGNEGARSLRTATTTSTWVPGAGIKGKITDLLGNEMILSGATLVDHQTFCTYVETIDTVYRTMIRVG